MSELATKDTEPALAKREREILAQACAWDRPCQCRSHYVPTSDEDAATCRSLVERGLMWKTPLEAWEMLQNTQEIEGARDRGAVFAATPIGRSALGPRRDEVQRLSDLINGLVIALPACSVCLMGCRHVPATKVLLAGLVPVAYFCDKHAPKTALDVPGAEYIREAIRLGLAKDD